MDEVVEPTPITGAPLLQGNGRLSRSSIPTTRGPRAYLKSFRGRRWRSPPQQSEQALDVVSQGGNALGDRPDSIEPEGIDGQAAEGGQDLDAVALPVAVGVFPQRHIAAQC